jgi:hypothetical protein
VVCSIGPLSLNPCGLRHPETGTYMALRQRNRPALSVARRGNQLHQMNIASIGADVHAIRAHGLTTGPSNTMAEPGMRQTPARWRAMEVCHCARRECGTHIRLGAQVQRSRATSGAARFRG